MWTGNYLTLDQFMAEAHDRFRFLEHELDEVRIKEWLYKAMGLIGVMSVYPDVVKELELTMDTDMSLSYAMAPSGVIQLNGVYCAVPPTDGILDVGLSTRTGTPLIKSSAITGWNDRMAPPSYQINGNIILTNLCDDQNIVLTYDSFPIDINGKPIIPDDVVYIEAMLAYTGYRMGYELWMMDRLAEAKYRELEREWLFYVNSAKTKMLMPSLDEMQSLVHQLQQNLQSPRQHSYKFKFLNYPQYSS